MTRINSTLPPRIKKRFPLRAFPLLLIAPPFGEWDLDITCPF
jgi:hypothetical protein